MRALDCRWTLATLLLAATCLLAAAAAAAPPTVTQLSFHPPSDDIRFFHARVALSASDRAYDVLSIDVNGNEEAFRAWAGGKSTEWQPNGRVDRYKKGELPAATVAEFVVRCPWISGTLQRIVFHCQEHGEGGEPFEVVAEGSAPEGAGFPFAGWKEHRILVLREDYGIPRKHEPFLLFLSEEGRRVASWRKELRVARFDIETGAAEEVPSQVLYEKRQFDTPLAEDVFTTTQIALLVDVPARGKAYYLIAYGNPEAEVPEYSTDLIVGPDKRGYADGPRDPGNVLRESGAPITIENSWYAARLHHDSGQLDGFTAKQFGVGENRRFGYMPDSGYPLHYNPDVWVRNRTWTHTKGWNPPPAFTVESGPVAAVVRRWGHLPRATEVEVEVVYHFFSQTPYILVESTVDVMRDVVVNALRNEEVVFSPSTEVDHAGWKRPTGEFGYKPIVQEEGLTPGMVQILEPDAPFVCLVREANALGMASLRLAQHAGSRGDLPPVQASGMTVLADYGWDFRYWSRSLVYPWGDYLPDQPTILNAGTYYGEKSAFCLFPLGEGDSPEARLAYLDALHERLSKPLRIDHQGAGPW